MPAVPCGSKTFKLCADCLKLLQPPNEPLTLEELMLIENEAVWCANMNKWGVVDKRQVGENQYKSIVGFSYGWEWLEDVYAGNDGKIYRKKVE